MPRITKSYNSISSLNKAANAHMERAGALGDKANAMRGKPGVKATQAAMHRHFAAESKLQGRAGDMEAEARKKAWATRKAKYGESGSSMSKAVGHLSKQHYK